MYVFYIQRQSCIYTHELCIYCRDEEKILINWKYGLKLLKIEEQNNICSFKMILSGRPLVRMGLVAPDRAREKCRDR